MLQELNVSFNFCFPFFVAHELTYEMVLMQEVNVNIVILTLFEGVVDIEQGQVVAIDVSESHLCLVRLFLHLRGPHEALRN